jgi:hypothetical protein
VRVVPDLGNDCCGGISAHGDSNYCSIPRPRDRNRPPRS